MSYPTDAKRFADFEDLVVLYQSLKDKQGCVNEEQFKAYLNEIGGKELYKFETDTPPQPPSDADADKPVSYTSLNQLYKNIIHNLASAITINDNVGGDKPLLKLTAGSDEPSNSEFAHLTLNIDNYLSDSTFKTFQDGDLLFYPTAYGEQFTPSNDDIKKWQSVLQNALKKE